MRRRATTNCARRTPILIALPTPLSRQREPDLSIVESAARRLAGVLHEGQLVVLESTTWPGTTRELLQPILEEGSGLRAGEGFFLAMSPERVDPGREDWTTKTTPKVLGGVTPECTQRAAALYRRAVDTVHERHEPRGRRADEAAGEHLPLGQHRPRQRARDPLRPDGDRHLGGRRRRRHQAVRLHAVQPGPRPRRPLHPDRSLLPQLEGARVRLLHGVHRARRQGQRGDAVLLPLARLAGAEPRMRSAR